mmetsp:Transcript_36416/g.81038  ORF Transcript_36416/g.81038 Transcript_36416/m.81038 type:complete len:91 (+) Transcript_36416:153-425(+)|eukprot:CAMPEP_0202919682 /NCGR_PEP_ID=MMETSP1392-20130828/76461_1 /ASSEMBLY_ACC=CAM_ASM_000868 /TAXON_ID=225041 /ORGANISM="Chlamydomonas chlamydogama, Strain SAG 11-48b" /LENGTH=90 /DNA_ID=CAMNT_0049613139 /DNA_START=500 /DNA_END=772 /DNA_ORIENTATION=-
MPKAAKGDGEKKEKKVKDPNAPKKPMGAYMFFCAEKREQLKKDNPELKVTEVAAKLGAMWKALDDKDKVKYQKQAEADKERYNKEVGKSS